MDKVSPLPARIRALPTMPGHLDDAFRLAADGCDVLFVHAPAGASIPAHTHDSDNLSVVVSGEMIVTVDGEDRTYRPGQWYETAAGQPHAVRFEADTVQVELRFR